VLTLEPSERVQPRSREARIARRRAQWRIYFQEAGTLSFSLAETPIWDAARLGVGQLLGLQDAQGLLLGLGVAEGLDRQAGDVILRTPLATGSAVGSLRVGAIRLDPSKGMERPGTQ
jgi:polynucleotide 5'-kinase involved in rRNA processing